MNPGIDPHDPRARLACGPAWQASERGRDADVPHDARLASPQAQIRPAAQRASWDDANTAPAGDRGDRRCATHWTRTLDHDFFKSRDDEIEAPDLQPPDAEFLRTRLGDDEPPVREAARGAWSATRADRLKGYPMKAAAGLIAIYIAMYLAVGGVVHIFTGPHAAAEPASGQATVAPASPPDAEGSKQLEPRGETREGTDLSRLCKPGAASDPGCFID